MGKQRESVAYFRQGDAVEVRHISNGKVVDTQGFKMNNENDNDKLFEYIIEKLGFSFKRYKRNKETEWQ